MEISHLRKFILQNRTYCAFMCNGLYVFHLLYNETLYTLYDWSERCVASSDQLQSTQNNIVFLAFGWFILCAVRGVPVRWMHKCTVHSAHRMWHFECIKNLLIGKYFDFYGIFVCSIRTHFGRLLHAFSMKWNIDGDSTETPIVSCNNISDCNSFVNGWCTATRKRFPFN